MLPVRIPTLIEFSPQMYYLPISQTVFMSIYLVFWFLKILMKNADIFSRDNVFSNYFLLLSIQIVCKTANWSLIFVVFFSFQVRIFCLQPHNKNSTDWQHYIFFSAVKGTPPYLLQNVKKPCVKYDHFCVWILISRKKSCQKVSFSYGNMHQLTSNFSS